MLSDQVWPRIERPEIEWRGDFPVGKHFDDIYFSTDGAIPETTEVFIEANDLPCRFVKLRSRLSSGYSQRAFTVGELGFGFGINFLLTTQKFLNEAPENARLLYVSTERFPVSREDLIKGHQNLPGLASLSRRLIETYPAGFVGFHWVRFLKNRVDLLLLIGDATEQLQELDLPIQAWFLDGFAPKKNPELWTEKLFQQVRRLSIPGETTLSSYSVAGHVRRALEVEGFIVEKKSGFSKKRERLVGHLPSGVLASDTIREYQDYIPPESVHILGSGIAAFALADELSHCGVPVTVSDSGSGLRTSNLPSGLLVPHLKKGRNPVSELSLRGYEIASHRARDYEIPKSTSGGLFKSYEDLAEFQAIAELIKRGAFPKEWAQIQNAGILFPDVASFQMPDWLDAFKKQNSILLSNSAEWNTGNDSVRVIAAGVDSSNLIQSIYPGLFFEIQKVRGQIDFYRPGQCPNVSMILSRHKHLTPVGRSGFHALGATYHRILDTEARSVDTEELVQKFSEDFSSFPFQSSLSFSSRPDHSWVGFRAATRDRLPLVGRIPETNDYVFTALGSRGFTFGSLGATVLAHQIVGDGLVIERRLYSRAMNPLRMMRGKK